MVENQFDILLWCNMYGNVALFKIFSGLQNLIVILKYESKTLITMELQPHLEGI